MARGQCSMCFYFVTLFICQIQTDYVIRQIIKETDKVQQQYYIVGTRGMP